MRNSTMMMASAAAMMFVAASANAQTAPATDAAASAPATATAPAAVTVTAGGKVSDDKGGIVGTVDSVANGVAVVNTGTVKVGVPTSSFAKGTDGFVIAMTKVQLEAAAQGAAAEAKTATKAQLSAGTAVNDTTGAPVGTITEVDDQHASIDTGKSKAKLPLTAFAASDSGVVVSMTKAQIEAAASAAAPAPTTTAAKSTSASADKAK